MPRVGPTVFGSVASVYSKKWCISSPSFSLWQILHRHLATPPHVFALGIVIVSDVYIEYFMVEQLPESIIF